MIYRSDYINAIRPFIDVPLVKILAGFWRSIFAAVVRSGIYHLSLSAL